MAAPEASSVPAKRPSANVTGRRGKLTEARLAKVVTTLASGGTIAEAATAAGVTDTRTLYAWMERSEDAREAILNARARGALAVSEKLLASIYTLLAKGDAKSVGEAAKHLRWHLSKVDPKTYGEHRDRAVQGVQINITTDLWSPEAGQPEIQTFHVEAPVDAEFTDAE